MHPERKLLQCLLPILGKPTLLTGTDFESESTREEVSKDNKRGNEVHHTTELERVMQAANEQLHFFLVPFTDSQTCQWLTAHRHGRTMHVHHACSPTGCKQCGNCIHQAAPLGAGLKTLGQVPAAQASCKLGTCLVSARTHQTTVTAARSQISIGL